MGKLPSICSVLVAPRNGKQYNGPVHSRTPGFQQLTYFADPNPALQVRLAPGLLEPFCLRYQQEPAQLWDRREHDNYKVRQEPIGKLSTAFTNMRSDYRNTSTRSSVSHEDLQDSLESYTESMKRYARFHLQS
jgi:hypothetical protein